MTLRETIATSTLLALLAFELSVLAILALFPYLVDPGLSVLNSNFYALLAPLSTVLLLGLLYAWPLKLIAREARIRSTLFDRLILFLSEPFQKIMSSLKSASLSETARNCKILSRPRLMLAVSLVVSILLTFIPYRPDLNPSATLVGVDSPLYVGWIVQMLIRPLSQALAYSFVEGLEGSRPLLLIPLYLVASTGVSPSQLVEYLPMVLAPLLSLSTYIFVRYGQGSRGLASLTALFCSVSFYTTVGLWGGYYANWLALILAFLFMTVLLVYSKKTSRLGYAAIHVLSIGLFLTHPWTWGLVVTVSLAFAFSLWRETRKKVHLESVLGIISGGVVLDVVKSWVFATRAVGVDVAGTFQTAGIVQLLNFWPNLVEALLYTHGGLIGNWLILGLGLLASSILRFRDWFERLLLLWIAVASIPFAVLDSYHQARIVYDLPLPVLVSIAVVLFLPRVGSKSLRWPGIVIAFLVVTMTNYALQGIILL